MEEKKSEEYLYDQTDYSDEDNIVNTQSEVKTLIII